MFFFCFKLCDHLEDEKVMKIKDRPELFLTAMIRGTDATGLAHMFYLMKKLIYGWVHNDKEIRYLLRTRVIKIVPLLNYDSYLAA